MWCVSSVRKVAMLSQQNLLHFSIFLRNEMGYTSFGFPHHHENKKTLERNVNSLKLIGGVFLFVVVPF